MESVRGHLPTTLMVGASAESLGLARVLGGRGEQVALMARSEVRLEQLRTQMEGEGIPCNIFAVDVTEPDSVLASFTKFAQWSRRLDRLIYSSSVVSLEEGGCRAEGELHRMMSASLFGFANCFQLARPMMKRGGGGTVIMVVSGPNQPMAESGVAEQVSRAAAQIYTAALRRELSKEKIFFCELLLGRVREGEDFRDLQPDEIVAGLLHMVDHRPERYALGQV